MPGRGLTSDINIKRSGVRKMKTIDDLIGEADELLARGEEKITVNPGEGYQLFQKAIDNLCKVYLTSNGQEPLGDLKALFFQCKRYNPEFEALDDALKVFTDPDPGGIDSEAVVDSANEIWDFITATIPTEEGET